MTHLAGEYAQALFALAREAEKEKGSDRIAREVYEELCDARRVLQEDPGTMPYLCSPVVPAVQRTQALSDAFSGQLTPLAMQFLCVMCKNGNMRCLNDCLIAYEQLLQAREGIAVAHVTGAVPMTDEEMKRLRQALENKTGKKIDVDFTLDPSVLGGITVSIGDKQWDGSVRRKLNTLKEVMKNGT